MNFKKLLGLALVSALALTGCNEEKKSGKLSKTGSSPTQNWGNARP